MQVCARVRRDSNWQVIPAPELVPGDIVRVRPGDIIPADVKLLAGTLAVDQSALIGESNSNALYTFSFLTLLYFAAFSIVSARERNWFWATMPSKTLVAAIMADTLAGTVLTLAGLPGLMPLSWWQTLTIFSYAMVSCLVVNDVMKVVMSSLITKTSNL